MIIRKVFVYFFIFVIAGLFNLGALEMTKDQYIRLILDDTTGNFSLYYLVDPAEMQYEPLFNDKDQKASFSAVSVNGRIYRLGESRSFETKIETIDGNPAVIHESANLKITKIFFPVRTSSSPFANGIRIGITIKNKTNKEINVGFRMLLDTHLGEVKGVIPFNTDSISITKETLVEGLSEENYWVSRGTRLSLMGNIKSPFNSACKIPDFVHFANWKKLYDVSWKAPYYEGRSFSYTHFSVNDSAVCYYYEPDMLGENGIFEYEILLTTEDTAWYKGQGGVVMSEAQMPVVQQTFQQIPQESRLDSSPVSDPFPAPVETAKTPVEIAKTFQGIPAIIDAAKKEASIYGEDENLVILRRLQEALDQFIAGEITLNEQDLLEVEMTIDRYKNG